MHVKLSPSMEDYLRAIYFLERQSGAVRVKNIAKQMEITMPSVSSALKNLEKQGLVCHPRYDFVGLTPEGFRIAEEVNKRHQVIKDFLSQILGIEHEIAEKDACGMEHSISPETLESLLHFLETASGKE